MYHYIRNFSREFPNYNFLEKKSFLKQINNFSREGIVSSNNEIKSHGRGNILTFDDGLKDHIWAAEQLKKRNLTVFSTSNTNLMMSTTILHRQANRLSYLESHSVCSWQCLNI